MEPNDDFVTPPPLAQVASLGVVSSLEPTNHGDGSNNSNSSSNNNNNNNTAEARTVTTIRSHRAGGRRRRIQHNTTTSGTSAASNDGDVPSMTSNSNSNVSNTVVPDRIPERSNDATVPPTSPMPATKRPHSFSSPPTSPAPSSLSFEHRPSNVDHQLNNPQQRPSVAARFQATALVAEDDDDDDDDAIKKQEERQRVKVIRSSKLRPPSSMSSMSSSRSIPLAPQPLPQSSQPQPQRSLREAPLPSTIREQNNKDDDDDDSLLDMDDVASLPPANPYDVIQSRMEAAQLVLDSRTSSAMISIAGDTKQRDSAIAITPGAIAIQGPRESDLIPPHSPTPSTGSTGSSRVDHAGGITEFEPQIAKTDSSRASRTTYPSKESINQTPIPRGSARSSHRFVAESTQRLLDGRVRRTTAADSDDDSQEMMLNMKRETTPAHDDDNSIWRVPSQTPTVFSKQSEHITSHTSVSTRMQSFQSTAAVQPSVDGDLQSQDDTEMAVTPGAYAVDGIGEGEEDDGEYDMYDTNWDDNATLNTNLAVSGPGSVVGSSHHHPTRSSNHLSSSMPPMEGGEGDEFAEGNMERGTEHTTGQQHVSNVPVADVALASKGGPPKKKWIMIGGGLLLCIIVVIIVVVVLMGGSDDGDSAPNSEIPVDERSIALTEIFSQVVVDPDALSRDGSLEHQAMEWIYNEDSTPLEDVEKVQVRFALILLYLNIAPSAFIATSGSVDECTWTYVTCSQDGRVTALNAPGLGLSGTIPIEFRQLSHLEQINLRANKITGSIGEQLESMTNLSLLNFGSNSLNEFSFDKVGTNIAQIILESNGLATSIVASHFGRLTSLKTLNIDVNVMQGQLESIILSLNKDMTNIQMIGNSFVGSIPTEIGLFTKLVRLDCLVNKLTGTLPTEMGLMTSLVALQLSRNKLVGNIPSELGQLSDGLRGFALHTNRLDGTIPTELGNLINLVGFEVSQNSLTGPIPTELGQFTTRLEHMALFTNSLRGTIPTEFGRLTAVKRLLLQQNEIDGEVPAELSNASSLRELHLQLTFLEGSISPELCALPDLIQIIVSQGRMECDCGSSCFFNTD